MVRAMQGRGVLGVLGRGQGNSSSGREKKKTDAKKRGGFKLNRFKRTGFPLNQSVRFSWTGLVFSGVWPGSSTSDIPLFFLAFSAILNAFSTFIKNLQNKIKSIKNLKNIIKTSLKSV